MAANCVCVHKIENKSLWKEEMSCGIGTWYNWRVHFSLKLWLCLVNFHLHN